MVIATMVAGWTMSAASPAKIENEVKKIVADYENVPGVDCMVIQKGEGLGLLKSMFNQSFGRKFMKGVTSLIMIEYTEATSDVAASLKSRFDSFAAVLDEYKPEDNELEEGEYMKCFAKFNGTVSVSDFMIIMEDKESKAYIYMGGELMIDKLDLQM